MAEFATFLKAHGFPYPKVMAPLSVGVQLACGVGFLTGILIRWAGLFCALNFIVAIMMVDGPAGIRPSFPSAMLVAFDGKSVVEGKSVSVRVDLVGRSIIKKKKPKSI